MVQVGDQRDRAHSKTRHSMQIIRSIDVVRKERDESQIVPDESADGRPSLTNFRRIQFLALY